MRLNALHLQVCPRPEVVEVWDVTAQDPKLLVYLKVRLLDPRLSISSLMDNSTTSTLLNIVYCESHVCHFSYIWNCPYPGTCML